MNNNSKRIFVTSCIVLTVILIVCFAFSTFFIVGYGYMRSKKNGWKDLGDKTSGTTSTPTPTPSPTSTPQAREDYEKLNKLMKSDLFNKYPYGYTQKANDSKKLYQSTLYGFSFEYPREWEIGASFSDAREVYIQDSLSKSNKDSGIKNAMYMLYSCDTLNTINDVERDLEDSYSYIIRWKAKFLKEEQGKDILGRAYTKRSYEEPYGTRIYHYDDFYYKTASGSYFLVAHEYVKTPDTNTYFDEYLKSLKLPEKTCDDYRDYLGESLVKKVFQNAPYLSLWSRVKEMEEGAV